MSASMKAGVYGRGGTRLSCRTLTIETRQRQRVARTVLRPGVWLKRFDTAKPGPRPPIESRAGSSRGGQRRVRWRRETRRREGTRNPEGGASVLHGMATRPSVRSGDLTQRMKTASFRHPACSQGACPRLDRGSLTPGKRRQHRRATWTGDTPAFHGLTGESSVLSCSIRKEAQPLGISGSLQGCFSAPSLDVNPQGTERPHDRVPGPTLCRGERSRFW